MAINTASFSRIQVSVALIILVLLGVVISDHFSATETTAPSRSDHANTTEPDGAGGQAFQKSGQNDNAGSEQHGATLAQKTAHFPLREDTRIAPIEALESPDLSTVSGASSLNSLRDLIQNTLQPALEALNIAQMDPDSAKAAQSQLDRDTAIELLASRLPPEMDDAAQADLLQVLYDDLPADEAEQVFEQTMVLYQVNAEQEAYLASMPPVIDMKEQIRVAQRLANMAGEQGNDSELVSRQLAEPTDAHTTLNANTPESEDDIAVQYADDPHMAQDVENAQEALAGLEDQWMQKYQAFSAQKQVIEQAGLSPADKVGQIAALFRQHYAQNEQEAARAFDQMMREQDKDHSHSQ